MTQTTTAPPASGGARPGRDGRGPSRPGVLRRWSADLAMGARFAFGGGREGWVRTALTAVGVGLGVTVLLVAASIPHLLSARDAREGARVSHSAEEIAPSEDTVLVQHSGTVYHDERVHGLLLQPEGMNAPAPPGVTRLPGPGERVVSPALEDLLGSPEGELLRERLAGRTVGTIGQAGLVHPHELVYYLGSDELSSDGASYRTDRFGRADRGAEDEGLPPELVLLVLVGCVTLLLPVAAFVAAAVRFGGERRDRRLAALRLVGADARMTRRVAAGEAAAGAVLGLGVGAALFLPLRAFADDFRTWGFSAFPSDITPIPLLAGLVAVAVPACAVFVSLLALRRVAIEPLGVVRNSGSGRRRLAWRLVPPAIGMVLLLPQVVTDRYTSTPTFQIGAGIVLVLIGVTALLPWLVEATVRRLRGGRLPFQLAVRRLQLDSGTAARAVSGITVAVAGAVALQMLFGGIAARETHETGRGDGWADVKLHVRDSGAGSTTEIVSSLEATPGVSRTLGVVFGYAVEEGEDEGEAIQSSVTVGSCSVLRAYAELGGCEDGDVFVVKRQGAPGTREPRPGMTVELGGFDREPAAGKTPDPVLWTVPEDARAVQGRPDPAGRTVFGVLATSQALDPSLLPSPSAEVFVGTDAAVPDAVEHLRNFAAHYGSDAFAEEIHAYSTSEEFAAIEQGLYVGAVAILLLIGAGMAVSALEQLRERKRLLSVLVAFGTRRSTLAWSVLWQTAVPVLLGLALAAITGVGLGAVLMGMARVPVEVDWAGLGAMTALGGLLIGLVTLLSLPVLWRLMRPDGLRTE